MSGPTVLTQITKGGRGVQEKNPAPTAAQLPAPAPGTATTVSGAYFHIPFCAHKCHYCDFYSLVGQEGRLEAFVDRMDAEIRAARVWITEPLETVFIGGGTPTLLPPVALRRLLASIRANLPLRGDVELTVEANPETVTVEIAHALAAGGVNRVSLGAQSFDLRHLRTLERRHDPANVERSVERLRAVGIARLNVDLIFGVPGQTADAWSRDLDHVVDLRPEHVSAYALTYEPGTPLWVRRNAGVVMPVEDALEATLYEMTCARLERAGFEHYEISNWARPGEACRHNVLYWTNRAWWPFGPSAAGHWGGTRWRNAPRLSAYLSSGPLPPIVDVEQQGEDGRVGEVFMLGLRLLAGLPAATVESLLAVEPGGARRRGALLAAEADGLLERTDGSWRLSRRGRLLADSVLAELL